ncbi:MAG: hypothetical protein MR440_08620 [Firmicutes bacterium]|nr:hypothetical protein [Bacillota bacterium]
MKEKLKVNLSIFELLLRNGGLKLAAVILLTMLAEGVLLYTMMQKETLYYENLFARGAAIPLMAGFVLLTLAMLNPMKASKSNLNYTLKRLRVKPAAIFAAETVYLMLAYAVFWALATGLLYGFGIYFTQNISGALNREIGLFLAFGRTHDLCLWLPIGNAALAVRNAVGIAALSAAAARFNCFLRKGETKAIAPLLTLVLFTRAFYSDISSGGANMVMTTMLLGMLLFCTVSTCFEEAEL